MITDQDNLNVDLLGNPWPRKCKPKHKVDHITAQNLKDHRKFTSEITASSQTSLFMLRKYYNKNISCITVSNCDLPRFLRHRLKSVKALKVFNVESVKCPLRSLKKLTINILIFLVKDHPGFSKLLKQNKHLECLRLSNFKIFRLFRESIESMTHLRKFYISLNRGCLNGTFKPLKTF